jgi:hypothetical protein
VYVPFAVNAPVACEPLVTLLPDHAPEAEQLVAFALFQVSVALLPLVIVVGLAESVTVGAGVGAAIMTVIVVLADAVPFVPVQVNVYVPPAANAPVDCEPLVALLPDQAPEAAQLLAFVVLHESVELLPLVTAVGLAVNVTVGVAPPPGVVT